ncbi:MAG TPA: thioredoxin family protein [Thermoanaerobaculia bacterium]|nr:thioredoxin family protein [Thermoanaerobaculia bacterium]
MKPRLLILIVLAALAAPQAFAERAWLKDVATAKKEAIARKQLILVDMTASWCGWCRKFEKEVYPSPVFEEAVKDVVLLRLDTEDGKEGTLFSGKYGVAQLPTFLLLTPDLTVAALMQGYSPAPEFALKMENARKAYAAFTNRITNEATIVKDPAQRLALAKELTQRHMFDKAEPRLKKLTTEAGIPIAFRDDAYFTLAITYTMQSKFKEALATIRELTSKSTLGEAVERALQLQDQIEQTLAASGQ